MHASPQKNRGFSLLEIVVALAVAMVILGSATLLIGSVNEEHRLRRMSGAIEMAARTTLIDAVSSHQSRWLVIHKNGLTNPQNDREISIPNLEIASASGWQKPKAFRWNFSADGICDPVRFRITDPAGVVELHIDPLTGEAADERFTILK